MSKSARIAGHARRVGYLTTVEKLLGDLVDVYVAMVDEDYDEGFTDTTDVAINAVKKVYNELDASIRVV